MSSAPQFYRSHAAIAPFHLHRPKTVSDAAAIRAWAGSRGAFLAGGVDLIPALRGGVKASEVIALGGVAALSAVRSARGAIRIGGGVTYRQLETDPVVADLLPDLPKILAGVANIRVRRAGTLAGNLMTARPTYDAAPILMALGATLDFAVADRTGGVRTVKAAAGRRPPRHGLLRSIEIPAAAPRRILFDRSLKPVVSVALNVEASKAGLTARAAVGCAHVSPQCSVLDTCGAGSIGDLAARSAEIAETFAAALPEPLADPIAGAAYRRKMAGLLVGRLLRQAGI